MKNLIKRSAQELVNLIFPIECVGCGKNQTWLCRHCLNSIPVSHLFICLVCLKPSPQGVVHEACRAKTSLDGWLIASSRQHQLLKELIRKFKYENLRVLAAPLASLLTRKIETSAIISAMLMSADTQLLPVPLHRQREWQRGYNQATLLAKQLTKVFPPALAANSVKRVKNTKTQTGKNRAKRQANIKSAFRVTKPEALAGKSVILIDDVTTSGATLNELASVVKLAGAKEVWAMVLSRG